uniref:(northern house mosquito) hypothetical protein n=1 Tax=Culex pipiens TaxID=7175 RepID=A0A8D8FZQ4_CULPI
MENYTKMFFVVLFTNTMVLTSIYCPKTSKNVENTTRAIEKIVARTDESRRCKHALTVRRCDSSDVLASVICRDSLLQGLNLILNHPSRIESDLICKYYFCCAT